MGSAPVDSTPECLFAVTICAKRKPGMDEDQYHEYISQKHAGHLKDLLVKNKIVDYTMIVFRNVQDYINVKDDPHYRTVVNPDHVNFADGPGTMMSFGWFENHLADGKLT
ncbi:hypothetical protein LTR49_026966 [Elasticomyces elasticus]|nr:hypothetical protein LTR49_026966 [Elasticomyces elasticus]